MACDGDFCDDYMVLNPNEGGFKDLFHLLFSSNMDKNNLVKCPEETEIHEFKRRFLIFAAVVVQKALAAGTKPLAWFGATLEMWLNLLTHNQSFCRLLLNLVQGKLVIPDKSSATFESGLSHLDNRIDLDKDIKHGDSRYHGAFAIMAAKLSYENEAFVTRVVHENWKMELLGFYNFWNVFQEKPTTQAFMLRDRTGDTDLIVVAFRGTETFDSDAWSTDFDLSWYNLPEKGKIHGGFAKALGLQKKVVGLKERVEFPKEIEQGENRPQVAYYAIRQKLRELLRENDQAKFIVTGHSLGGALAALFPVILALHDEGELLERMEGVYTFGQPRIGDEQLGEFMKEQMTKHNVKYIRYVYGNDMVPRLPMDDKALLFKHFGTCIYYNSFFYQGQIVEEEPNKNYFSLLWAIPKMANAVWELVRSFIIRYKMGPEYRESWYLGAHRLIGILIPGVPAHAPFDYVNATRRGTLSLPVEESTHLLRQGPKAD